MTYLALGSVDNDRAAYVAWTGAVRASGGRVTTFPFHDVAGGQVMGDPFGSPAALYPIDVVYPPPSYQLSSLFHREPDGWTADSSGAYYLAPIEAARYVQTGEITAPESVPGETPPPNPNWYDTLQNVVHAVPWIIGGAAMLYVLSLLPRPRNG